ncbi:acyl-CoA synthetase FdrA [Rhizobium sp. CRIBSB]|nr:acyl-CoA synthetase FdrA [Rhizobium sp. CRIBSB]
MASRVLIRPKEYHDSVRLMRVSEALRRESGVSEAMVMMATANNKKILETSGLLTDSVRDANPDDLAIAVIADTEESADAAIGAAGKALSEKSQAARKTANPRSLDSAYALKPDARLVVISVPGQFAFREAKRALEIGLNVLMFSDNMPLDEEKALKMLAADKNRLMMGPDCGTALINGIGFGFANKVARGAIGIVGASGTGIQEISCLLDAMGEGVSHAIGTGGRDLHEEIGGLTMLQGLKLLAEDPNTEVIIVASKPPSPQVAEAVLRFVETIGKPVVVNFLGKDQPVDRRGHIFAKSLADTAHTAARLRNPQATLPALPDVDTNAFITASKAMLAPTQRYVRGLYAGGTLCYEAMLILNEALGPISSNLAYGDSRINDLFSSRGHTVIDMGDDAYTDGRAHPMIDPFMRNQRILQEAQDPEVALLLLDLVIGYGAHADPAGALAVTIRDARALAAAQGRQLPIIVTICGTRNDIQNYDRQRDDLVSAGIQVVHSNAEAAALAARLLRDIHATH